MSKLTIFIALFAALVTIASATTYTTTSNPKESCQAEIMQHRMRSCQQWMRTGTTGTPQYYLEVANPQYEEEHLEECCGELRRVSSGCRCEAVSKVMSMWQQEHGVEEEEMHKMMKKKAESLPRMCKMKSPTECRIKSVFF